jgi:chemosensory pili system protein ChpA (sensor histidine kinase/response regulator)
VHDIAPLAWVIDEIRASLTEATSRIKSYLGNKADVDGLRTAGQHVHQVSGALQLLDLRGVGLVTEAVEQLCSHWDSEPNQCMPAAVRTVDATLSAVRNYLDALIAGRDLPPIRLYPYYREILVLLGAPRVHPADLVFPDLSRRPTFHQLDVRSLSADELRIRRVLYEEGLVRFLRDPEDAHARARMRKAVVELEGLPQRGLARSFWWVARALFDALDSFQLPVDNDLKRFLARLNQQLRRQIEGGPAVAERLMIDALYHVGRADDRIERVAQVKQLYGLATLIPPDFERATLTTIDTEALTALRASLSQCKLLWGQLVAGDAPDATRFRAEVGRAQASAVRLGATAPARVLGCIGEVTPKLAQASPATRETLGMEVATALLLLESGSEWFPQVDAQFEKRADAMIDRILRASEGMPLPEGDEWIAELARHAQERSSMDTVVAEMRTMLREAELRLDRFFRNPAQRKELPELETMFDQVGGVLGVLGFEDPAAALRQVRDAVRRYVDPATAPNPEEFSRIAHNLGAVGFFVTELAQEPTKPHGVFRFDAQSGVLSANMGVTTAPAVDEAADEDEFVPPPPAAVEPVAAPVAEATAAPPAPHGESVVAAPAPEPDVREAENVEHSVERLKAAALAAAERLLAQPGDRQTSEQLAPILAQLLSDAELMDDAALRTRVTQAARALDEVRAGGGVAAANTLHSLLRPPSAEVPALSAPLPDSAVAADLELHEIFVEEADEVLESVGTQLAHLRRDPADSASITMARRAFHTLKGSSRMVGLRDFGEFAWALEQCFNVWLAQERPANADLLGLAAASADRMRDWIEALRADPAAHVDASAFIHAAHVVRDGGAFTLPYALEPGQIVDPGTETIEVTAAPPPDGFDEAEETEEQGLPAGTVDDLAGLELGPAERGASDPKEEARHIGPLVISHGLYSVFLNESDECIRALAQEIGEWRYEPGREVSASILRLAHTLVGISDTVGLMPVSALADPLDATMQYLYEHRSESAGRAALHAAHFDVLERSIERMRGMLHQFAAGAFPAEAPLEAGALRDLLTELQTRVSEGDTVNLRPAETAPSATGELPAITPASETDAWFADTVPLAASDDERLAEAPWPTLLPTPEPPTPPPTAATPAPALMHEPAARAPAHIAAEPEAEDYADALSGLIHEPLLRDDIDEQLLQVFSLEAQDLLPAVAKNLRALVQNPNQRDVARDMMRHLHTLKGSARMAGAMRLGEQVHDMETRIESAMQLASVPTSVIEDLQTQFDQALALFESLQHPGAAGREAAIAPARIAPTPTRTPAPPPAPAAPAAGAEIGAFLPVGPGAAATAPPPPPRVAAPPVPAVLLPAAAPAMPAEVAAPVSSAPPRTFMRMPPPTGPSDDASRRAGPLSAPAPEVAASYIRVRSDVIDRLVDHAGEVSIARSKLESEVTTLRGSLADLTENIQRLRSQLREVELQADAQLQARSDQVAKQSSSFDPLEFDRYSRLQELTRLLAESVEDVALVQSNMVKGLQLADNDLSAQSRLTRELQQQLMRVRLVPFSNVSERLYRVARQAAKELQKRAHLDILGGETEVDRSLLEQMAGPFEHLVRNAIVHGLELPSERLAQGKSDTGELRIEVRREGNEIVVTFADDGAGLDLERIRMRAIAAGLLAPERKTEERDLVEFIFAPGLSTAREVTELAGRGVGMDVVRAQVASLGGRIAVTTERGKGARFTLYLPMTLSIMQVVLATVGERRYALPAAMVEQARRIRARELRLALQQGSITFGDVGDVTLRPLAQLLGNPTVLAPGEQYSVALLRLGDDRLAVSVDELSANQEVVVKSVGPQVARLAGVLGATVLGNGQVVLIINPVQLIGRAPEPPLLEAIAPGIQGGGSTDPSAPNFADEPASALVMVVDDSLTVRRVTQRLLERNGYRTILAKDGVDAMRELQDVTPDVMLVDIEMPRMDGYDLTRNVRGGSATRQIPIIMITSRTAEKHRRVAFELGVNEYLGKPYREDELLALIRGYVTAGKPQRA